MGDILLTDPLALARESFMAAKEAERLSPRTLEAYTWSLDRFCAWLRERAVTSPAEIAPAHIRAYFAMLRRQKLTAWTVHDYARPVKTWLRFLHADELIPSDIMARVKMPRLEKPILPSFTPEDVRAMLAACTCERDTALILFLLDTGVRSAEFCALTVGSLDRHTGAVMVRRGKGGKDRMVFIGAQTRKALTRYLYLRGAPPDSEPLFPKERKPLGPLTPHGLLQVFRRMARRSGVQHCHPHTFRRTFALWSLRAGMDLVRLAALMGHSDVSILRQYLALALQDLEGAHRDFGAVDTFMRGRQLQVPRCGSILS